ncbi:hypothetical protein Q3C01_44355, partial [Bradyrhizobium sp. UFLA05-109]
DRRPLPDARPARLILTLSLAATVGLGRSACAQAQSLLFDRARLNSASSGYIGPSGGIALQSTGCAFNAEPMTD